MAGLTYTTSELELWRYRRANGYTRPVNMPDTLAASQARALYYINNPGTDYFDGDPYLEDPTDMRYIVAAAWEYLCDGNTNYGNPVHDHVVATVQEPSLDFSTFTTLAAGGDRITFAAGWVSKLFYAFDWTRDLYSGAEIAMIQQWLFDAALFFQRSANERTLGLSMKFRSDNGKYDTVALMLADQANQIESHYYWVRETNLNYEFNGTATASINDYTPKAVAKRQHFYDNDTYADQAAMLADQANHVLGECYTYTGRSWGESYIYKGVATGNISDYKFQRIWDVYSYFDYLSPALYTHYNAAGEPQNQIASFNAAYNNRTALWAWLLMLVGLEVDDEFMIDQAKLWHEESIMFGIYPDGESSEARRNGDYGYISQGTLSYAIIQLETHLRCADLLWKNKDDDSLFTFTTSAGIQGSEGGTKNVRLWIENVIEHCTSEVLRYYLSVDPANIIDPIETLNNRRFLPEMALAIGNKYFNNDRIKATYLNTIAGSTQYDPAFNYSTGGVGFTFGGSLGAVPDFPLMEYEIESIFQTMSITLIGNNLNTYGNSGQFETDRSTWGFSDDAIYWSATRSSTQKTAGNYSCKLDVTGSYNSILGEQKLIPANVRIYKDKYYIAKAKVYIPSSDVPYANDDIVAIESVFGVAETSQVIKTIAQCTDSWQEIEFRFKFTADSLYGINYKIYLVVKGITGATPPAGDIYVDEFTVYEYEEVAAPTCNLGIDAGNSTVTHETAVDANDGTITVATTGGTAPLEYSKDNINWQSSNQFTGLAPGSYTIYVRDSASTPCTAQAVFNIDEYGLNFDFTATVVDESIAGAEDGSIEITVTGTGSPFTYSKDNGSNYQSSNIFGGLAPGNYPIVVKDSGGATKTATVTVDPGSTLFDKIYFSKNPIEFKRYSSSANYNKDNYKIHIDVQYEAVADSGSFSHLMYASKAPSSVLTPNIPVSFNIAPAFRGIFTPLPPAKNEATIKRLTDRIKFYKINYGDVYEQLESPASFTPSNPFLVMYGGLSKKKYSEIDYFYNYLPINKKFMTWAPLTKEVDYAQEDYLQFWCYGQLVSTVKLWIKAYYDDDTNETEEITSLAVSYGHLLQIPAGPFNSGAIGINGAKNLKYYELWLSDQNDAAISEVRTYKLTEFKHPRTRYYLFLNSLGAYEVLRTTGFSEKSIEVTREVIERFYGFGTYTTFGQYMNGEAMKRKGTKVSSGFFSGSLSKKWLDYMQEPALSRFVFEITDGVRTPLINMTKDLVIEKNEDNKRFARFEFLDAFSDQCYTPDDVS